MTLVERVLNRKCLAYKDLYRRHLSEQIFGQDRSGLDKNEEDGTEQNATGTKFSTGTVYASRDTPAAILSQKSATDV